MHSLTARARLLAMVALEAVAIPLLHHRGAGAAIDWGHLSGWLTATAPEDAVVAAVRLVALVLAGWLLATTVVYFLATATRVPALVRATAWTTLPAVRRVVDAALAMSLVGGTVLAAHPAGAQVGPPPI